MDCDLTTLDSALLLRKIQELLLNNSSEAVRELIIAQGVNIENDAALPRNDNNFSKQDLLNSPFFVIQNLRPLPVVENSQHHLTGNISKTARKVLSDFYAFNVTFGKWNDFEALVSAQDITSLGTLPATFRNWGELLKNLLSQSFHSSMGPGTGEVQELVVLHSMLRHVFAAFDFAMNVKNGSDDNVTGQKISTKTDFLFSEGKESSFLPRFLRTDGHRLCSFGFATKLARIQWTPPSPSPSTPPPKWHKEAANNNELRAALQTYLQVGGPKPSEKATTSVQPSERTNAILRDHKLIPNDDVEFVLNEFAANRIEPSDAVNMWAAVMQACIYSVETGKTMTVVQSVRMWWFIKLNENEYKVSISTASIVGSQEFLETVIKFLSHAQGCPTMNMASRRRWERAIAVTDTRSENLETNRATAALRTTSGGRKRQRQSSSPGNTSLPASAVGKNCTPSVVSFDDSEANREIANCSCFGYDKYGMEIPWFDQIGDSVEVLGRGRSGEVTKVMWNSRPVALKTFTLQFDDERSPKDVYEHELEVLWSLRSLWGQHVPEVLFHKPWPVSPMIGMELGEPLPDDMSEWSEDDLKQAKEAINEIENLGWTQSDVRGSNFVRLKGIGALERHEGRIAMIDFESVERMAARARPEQ